LALALWAYKNIATDGSLRCPFELDPAPNIEIESIRIGIIVDPVHLPINGMPTKADATTGMAITGIIAKGIAIPA
jgi:hypothetical protein